MSSPVQVPQGFELDEQSTAPKPPPGFELESAEQAQPVASHGPAPARTMAQSDQDITRATSLAPRPEIPPADISSASRQIMGESQQRRTAADPAAQQFGAQRAERTGPFLKRPLTTTLAQPGQPKVTPKTDVQELDEREMPGSFEGHPENLAGYVEEGPIKAARGVGRVASTLGPNGVPINPEEAATGASEVLQGVGTTMVPTLPFSVAAAPVSVGVGLATGFGASKATDKALEHTDLPPEVKQVASDAAWFLPSLAGHIMGARGFAAPEEGAGAVEAFGGKVRAGVASTPEGVQVAGRVGPLKGRFTVPGTRPAGEAPGLEPPTIDGGTGRPVQPPKVAAATEALSTKAASEMAAARVARGMPPVPPPPPQPPPPMVNDQTAKAVAEAIKSLPPEQQPAAILEATHKAAESIAHHGGAVVDGEVHPVTSPEQALKIAKKVMDGQIAKHDEAAASEISGEKPEVAKPTDNIESIRKANLRALPEEQRPFAQRMQEIIDQKLAEPQPPAGFELAQPDRRTDVATRKKVGEMSPDEMKQELLTSPVTGIPNRRAFDEAEHAPAKAVGMSDADGLKALNDRFGYEAGNQLLKAKADALKEAGLDAYHEKGDEFLYRGASSEEIQSKLEKAREILRNKTIEVTKNDGTVLRFKGADFSYGTGSKLTEAETGLKSHKSEREARGERARGELRRIVEVGPEGSKEHPGSGQPQEVALPTKDKPFHSTRTGLDIYHDQGDWYTRPHSEGKTLVRWQKVKNKKAVKLIEEQVGGAKPTAANPNSAEAKVSDQPFQLRKSPEIRPAKTLFDEARENGSGAIDAFEHAVALSDPSLKEFEQRGLMDRVTDRDDHADDDFKDIVQRLKEYINEEIDADAKDDDSSAFRKALEIATRTRQDTKPKPPEGFELEQPEQKKYDPSIGDRVEYTGDLYDEHRNKPLTIDFAQGGRVRLKDPATGERLEGWFSKSEVKPTELRTKEENRLLDDETSDKSTPIDGLIDAVYRKLKLGESLGNVTELNRLAESHLGDWRTGGKITPKDVFDAMEAGVNKYLIDRGKALMAMDPIEGLKELRGVMEKLTSQGVRTEEQIKNQQFSTPPTESYIAARVADLKPSDVMLEPSAGNGGLAVWAKAIGAEVHVNEISERRQEMLEAAGFDKPSVHDGEIINSLLDTKIKPTVVVMNPPFSASTLKSYEAKNRNQCGFNHVDSALQRLEPNGRLVAILGGGQANEPNGGASLAGGTSGKWFDKVSKTYNIRANVRINGKEYQKYGTSFATRLIVIDKDGPTADLKNVVQGNVNTLEEAYNLLRQVAESRPQVAGAAHDAARTERTEPATGLQRPGSSRQEPVSTSRVGADQSISPAGSRVPTRGEPATSGQTQPPDRLHKPDRSVGTNEPGQGSERVPLHQPEDRPQKPAEAGPVESARGRSENPDGERPLRGTEVDDSLALGRAAKTGAEQEDSSAYVTYHPSVEGPKHPGAIVETKTMATVPLPEINYKPSLPDSVIKEGKLSAVQLEAIALAGQQNEILLPGGFRASALIGDGTGVGKGRIGAGILWDNWRKGRKRLVWVSENWNLMNDANRDLSGIGAKIPVKAFQKYKVTDPIDHEGVLFTTYALLRSEDAKGNSRIAQLQKWMRSQDEGDGSYILFDESHNLKNAVAAMGGQESQVGKTVKEFLSKNPKIRPVSLSATAATDVINLGYLDRLGLWGPGTAFPNGFPQFAAEIGGGGISAMEMVARELKAQGKYISRTLSFKGVTYDSVEHKLTSDQKELYRTAVKAWRSVVQKAEQTIIETNNGGHHAVARFMSLFYGAQLRFFNVLLTTLKIPTAVEQANKALGDGKSVVITLINTNEAAQNREKNKMATRALGDDDEIPEYDFGPAEMLSDLVREHYPTQQYKDDVDSNGNPIKVPVVDEEGAPVHNPEAIKQRDQLLSDIKRDLKLPANPLDILINSFGGAKKVAELTGRKERFDQATGKFVKRGDPNVKREDINKAEAAAFQAGKKRVAILSNAASTGISLQSDLGAANQQKRHHITLQVGWSADKAMQMMGRTHRTNQAHPPEYVNIVSDLGGEQRFNSTIAKRMGSLGALTKGQKNATGGTDAMDKVNFESDQGRAAAKTFYDRMLHNTTIPGIDQKGMSVLEDLAVLKEDPRTGVKTVPDKDRTNVTRLLNRLLALDPDIQNPVYNYYYDIFQATVKQAVEDGTLDTGVKTLPGDEFHIREQRAIAKDKDTGAETFYYPIDAKVKTERMSVEDLEKAMKRYEKSTPRLMRNEKGKLILALEAPQIVHADGRVENANYMFDPGHANSQKVEAWKLNDFKDITKDSEDAIKDAEEDVRHKEQMLERAKQTAEKYKGQGWAEEAMQSWQQDLAEAEKKFEEVTSNQKDPLAAAKAEWQKHYDETPSHTTEEHHLVGGALLKYWNPIREASNEHLRIYTAVDSKTGERVVGVDVPGEQIKGLISRISGGKSTVDASQLGTDVVKNNLEYTLEQNIQVRRGRVSGYPVVQFFPPTDAIASNLKRLGLLYERGAVPVYYVPNERTFGYGAKASAVPNQDIIDKVLSEYPVKPDEPADKGGDDTDGDSGRRFGSQRGAVSLEAFATPVIAAAKLAKRAGQAWQDIAGATLQKLHMGQALPEVATADQSLARLMQEHRAAPMYYRAMADHIVKKIVGDLTREQEKGFVLLADKDSNDWLNENHHDEWLRYQDDPAIQKALTDYKPREEELREAQRSLGGPVIEEDYLRRVYDKHIAGINSVEQLKDRWKMLHPEASKEEREAAFGRIEKESKSRAVAGKGSDYPKFDKVITPQMANKKSRQASPEYYYKYGLHEFGPSFASRYVATHLKLVENAIASHFISQATKVEGGDGMPAHITYNGTKYYSPEAIRLIRISRRSPEEGKQLAEEMGLEQLPKPWELKPYGIYSPFSGSKLDYAARTLAQTNLKTKEFADKIKPDERTIETDATLKGLIDAGAGQSHGMLHNMGIRYLGPRKVVDAMESDARDAVPEWVRTLGGIMGPVVGGIRQQLLITGIPHIKNILRRVMQQSPGAHLDPRSWSRAWKVLFDKELKARALAGPDDPTFNALLKHAGISTEGAINYQHYLNLNFDDGAWQGIKDALSEAFEEPGVKGKAIGVSRVAGETIRAIPTSKFGKFWHDKLFGPGGIDPRARILIADLVRSEDPSITDAELADRINDQLGRYARASWTDFQRALAPFMMFPGWNYSSANWVLKHPFRTVLPAAIITMLANAIIHHYRKNREKDKYDWKRIHVGGRSWSDTMLRERMGNDNPMLQVPLDYAKARRQGKRGGEALGIALSGLSGDAGALLGEANPLVTIPMEFAMNRRNLFSSDQLINKKEFRHRGKVLPQAVGGKGMEHLLSYGAEKLFPQTDAAYPDAAQGFDPIGFAGRNLGTSTFSDKRRHSSSSMFTQSMSMAPNEDGTFSGPTQPVVPPPGFEIDEQGHSLDAAPDQKPEIVPPGGADNPEPIELRQPTPATPEQISKIGDEDSRSGRTILQPKRTMEANQKLATAAYPELEARLSQVASGIQGVKFDRLRPQKSEDRMDEKSDNRPPNTLSDYIAAQVAIDTPKAKDQMLSAIKRNFKVIDVEDKFLNGRPDKAYYPSANVQVQLSNGATAEIQLVPKEVQDVVLETHPYYKAGREAEARGDNEERDRQWGVAAEMHKDALERFKQRNAARPQIAKGDEVTIKGGQKGTVQYVHPMMNIARVRTSNGTRTVNLGDLA